MNQFSGRSVYFLVDPKQAVAGFKKYDEYDPDTKQQETNRESIQEVNSSQNIEFKHLHERYKFSEKELSLIKKRLVMRITNMNFIRFDKISVNRIMNYNTFKESLGILGVSHAQFLSERIFRIIDRNNTQKVTFEDFVHYLNILINGSQYQKAQMSFKFLDYQNKGVLYQSDIEKLIIDVIIFWNYMTGSRVVPSRSQIDKIINCLDSNKNGEISFQEYFKQYEQLNDLLDWFEFFNSDEKQILEQEEKIPSNNDYGNNLAKSIRTARLDTTLSFMQDSMLDLALQLKAPSQLRKKNSFMTGEQSSFLETSISGPLHISFPTQAKMGDQDPNEENQQNKQIQQEIENISLIYEMSNNTQNAQNNFDDKISKMLQMLMTEELIEEKEPQNLPKFQFGKSVQNRKISQEIAHDIRRATMANVPIQKQTYKKNLSVYFGHQNWNLILNMMIGMRTAVKTLQPSAFYQELKVSEFNTKHVYDIITQRSRDFDYRKAFQFIDYCPSIFNRIRLKFGISQSTYLRSVGPENMLGNLIMGKLTTLSELSSSGKSGSFFYFTEDSI